MSLHLISDLSLGQQSKDSFHTLRLCHLNVRNTDGALISIFGFEITEDPEYDYPIISWVEPKLPGERSGLQAQDVLLKVNDRKTKGLNFAKVQKTIEKAKRTGRLEMLVADKKVFEFCKQARKKFKEPDIMVKHIFPQSSSSTSCPRLPSIAITSSSISQENIKQIKNEASPFNIHHLPLSKDVQLENKKNKLKPSTFEPLHDSDMSLPISPVEATCTFFLRETSSPASDRALSSSPQSNNTPSTNQREQSQTSTNQSIQNFISNTFNSFFQHSGSQKLMKCL